MPERHAPGDGGDQPVVFGAAPWPAVRGRVVRPAENTVFYADLNNAMSTVGVHLNIG
jgi:hypothetical protein